MHTGSTSEHVSSSHCCLLESSAPNRSCLPTNCAWPQVASKFMPLDSTLLGVDIMPIKPIRGVQTFIEDITTAKCRATVKKAANGKLMDVILHDGAPNVGGVFSKEMYNQVRSLSQPDSPRGLWQIPRLST